MTQKNGCSRLNCQPRETFVAQARRENEASTQNGEKQDHRGNLKSRDIRQVHSMRRVEVTCQNRDSLKEDVRSSLARRRDVGLGDRSGEADCRSVSPGALSPPYCQASCRTFGLGER